MSSTKTAKIRGVIVFAISGLFLAAAVLLVLNRQYVLDQFTVWGYQPSSGIQSINEQVGFTDKGLFVFFAAQPELENQDDFNRSCPRQEAASPILGCYTTADRIYIYDITATEMNGIEEVTAVHEMLHAAWYRLSTSQRTSLGSELRAAYEALDNPALKERMEYYQRTEPSEFTNELHSILGTEVASLSESLETYYEQYFDRSNVLALHRQYSDQYKALNERATELYRKMQSLSTTIQNKSDTYEASSAQLSADISSFNRRAQQGSFTSYSQFYAERSALMQRTNALEADRRAINNDINTYNTYHAEYEKIATKIEVLNDSIDSYKQLEQAPSV